MYQLIGWWNDFKINGFIVYESNRMVECKCCIISTLIIKYEEFVKLLFK